MYIERIESMGGVVKCIESGWIQNEIQKPHINTRWIWNMTMRVVVGVNKFTQENEEPFETLK